MHLSSQNVKHPAASVDEDRWAFSELRLDAVLELARDAAQEIVFGASDPKDFARRRVGQMVKVHISLVEHDNFTRMDTGTQLAGALGFMFGTVASCSSLVMACLPLNTGLDHCGRGMTDFCSRFMLSA
jgi:hypothetical protein